MEEGWGQPPSQPSNFVSLLHLRERWLTQNHPNQQPKAQVQGNNDQPPEDANPLLLHKPRSSTNHRSGKLPGYYRAVPVSSRPCNKSVDEAHPLPAVSDEKKLHQKRKPRSQSGDVGKPLSAVSLIHCDEKKNKPESQSQDVGEPLLPVSSIESEEKKNKSMKKQKHRSQSEDEGEPLLPDPPIKADQKKNKSKRNGRRKKPVDTTSPTPEENLKEEMSEAECELAKQNEKKDVRASPIPEVNLKKGMRGKECEVRRRAQSEKKYVWARKIDEKKGVETQCGSGTANSNAMKEIENKLTRISVSFESKRGTNNGVYNGSSQANQNIRGHRNLRRVAPRKQIDAGMIWVRKDELPIGA